MLRFRTRERRRTSLPSPAAPRLSEVEAGRNRRVNCRGLVRQNIMSSRELPMPHTKSHPSAAIRGQVFLFGIECTRPTSNGRSSTLAVNWASEFSRTNCDMATRPIALSAGNPRAIQEAMGHSPLEPPWGTHTRKASVCPARWMPWKQRRYLLTRWTT